MVGSKKVISISPVPFYTQIKEILRMWILDRRKTSAERPLQTDERLCNLASLLVMTTRIAQLGA